MKTGDGFKYQLYQPVLVDFFLLSGDFSTFPKTGICIYTTHTHASPGWIWNTIFAQAVFFAPHDFNFFHIQTVNTEYISFFAIDLENSVANPQF